MTITEEVINCRELLDYRRSTRITPFTVVCFTFNYVSDERDRRRLDTILAEGIRLADLVNPAAANASEQARSRSRIVNNATAGVLAELCWKLFINRRAGREVVSNTAYTSASNQIDLIINGNNKRIEVRSSFPRNGINFAICHQIYQFDILGPYSNSVKPGEIQKDFYVRILYHIPRNNTFLDLLKLDNFKAYLTGGATWTMMTNNSISKNKNLQPEDEISDNSSSSIYRVVPFSNALHTIEIYNLIIAS